MPEAPVLTPLGASTLNRDWRLEIDTGSATGGTGTATATSGSADLTLASHGLVANQPVTLTGTPATPFTTGTVYYVSATGLTTGVFRLATTPGGAPVTATAAGSVTFTKGPVWTPVLGKKDFKPGIDSNLEDDSDMDSAGWQSQTKTAAGWMLEFKVARKRVVGASTYDPGQEALRLAADQFGPYNVVSCRWYKLGAVRVEAYSGYGAVTWEPEGGEMSALDEASVTITGQGQRTAIPHPYTGV